LSPPARSDCEHAQSNCPSAICCAGFFGDRYASTTLFFHKSEKLGKGLDLGFRDNNEPDYAPLRPDSQSKLPARQRVKVP
jgi:hypothetical protein